MLIKRKDQAARTGGALAHSFIGMGQRRLDRRSFLRRSGGAVGGLAAVSAMSSRMFTPAEAATPHDHSQPFELRKNRCTHCAVGCTVIAEVQNGVWVGQ